MEARLIEAPAPGAARDYKMLIGGEWVEALSEKTFASINPYTGRAWATAPEAGEEDVGRAVRAALHRGRQRTGGRAGLWWRGRRPKS
jgi:acyl-CoA reductase-like NAD-dependent aldehyde dehydrogenase